MFLTIEAPRDRHSLATIGCLFLVNLCSLVTVMCALVTVIFSLLISAFLLESLYVHWFRYHCTFIEDDFVFTGKMSVLLAQQRMCIGYQSMLI